jgi:hypothetical protein
MPAGSRSCMSAAEEAAASPPDAPPPSPSSSRMSPAVTRPTIRMASWVPPAMSSPESSSASAPLGASPPVASQRKGTDAYTRPSGPISRKVGAPVMVSSTSAPMSVSSSVGFDGVKTDRPPCTVTGPSWWQAVSRS